MHKLKETLKEKLLAAASEPAPHVEQLDTRPVFLLATSSSYGTIYTNRIAPHLKNLIAVIDDFSSEPTLHGAPRWDSAKFLSQARNYPHAVALDFSCGPNARGWVRKLCAEANIERRDYMQARAQLGLNAVYETVTEHRQKTLAHLDAFINLADRMDDDFSKATLYANLLFRLTYDREYLMQVWSNPSDEYFSALPDTTTFSMGKNEHYCDCGAYQGPIIKKFLGATGYQYKGIAAFEPDPDNYKTLCAISHPLLPNMRFVNKATSDRHETLRFNSLGTMSSHVQTNGNVAIESTRLDDELEDLTFLKMDVEGFEGKTLAGCANLIHAKRPRAAIAAYHYATDLLDIVARFDEIVTGYHFRLRQHNPNNFTDLILYASPVQGIHPPEWAR